MQNMETHDILSIQEKLLSYEIESLPVENLSDQQLESLLKFARTHDILILPFQGPWRPSAAQLVINEIISCFYRGHTNFAQNLEDFARSQNLDLDKPFDANACIQPSPEYFLHGSYKQDVLDPDKKSFDDLKNDHLKKFIKSIKKNDLAAVKKGIQQEIPLNQIIDDQLPIHVALKTGHVEIIRALLGAPSIDPNLLDIEEKNTPLSLAIESGNLEITELLMQHPRIITHPFYNPFSEPEPTPEPSTSDQKSADSPVSASDSEAPATENLSSAPTTPTPQTNILESIPPEIAIPSPISSTSGNPVSALSNAEATAAAETPLSTELPPGFIFRVDLALPPQVTDQLNHSQESNSSSSDNEDQNDPLEENGLEPENSDFQNSVSRVAEEIRPLLDALEAFRTFENRTATGPHAPTPFSPEFIGSLIHEVMQDHPESTAAPTENTENQNPRQNAEASLAPSVVFFIPLNSAPEPSSFFENRNPSTTTTSSSPYHPKRDPMRLAVQHDQTEILRFLLRHHRRQGYSLSDDLIKGLQLLAFTLDSEKVQRFMIRLEQAFQADFDILEEDRVLEDLTQQAQNISRVDLSVVQSIKRICERYGVKIIPDAGRHVSSSNAEPLRGAKMLDPATIDVEAEFKKLPEMIQRCKGRGYLVYDRNGRSKVMSDARYQKHALDCYNTIQQGAAAPFGDTYAGYRCDWPSEKSDETHASHNYRGLSVKESFALAILAIQDPHAIAERILTPEEIRERENLLVDALVHTQRAYNSNNNAERDYGGRSQPSCCHGAFNRPWLMLAGGLHRDVSIITHPQEWASDVATELLHDYFLSRPNQKELRHLLTIPKEYLNPEQETAILNFYSKASKRIKKGIIQKVGLIEKGGLLNEEDIEAILLNVQMLHLPEETKEIKETPRKDFEVLPHAPEFNGHEPPLQQHQLPDSKDSYFSAILISARDSGLNLNGIDSVETLRNCVADHLKRVLLPESNTLSQKGKTNPTDASSSSEFLSSETLQYLSLNRRLLERQLEEHLKIRKPLYVDEYVDPETGKIFPENIQKALHQTNENLRTLYEYKKASLFSQYIEGIRTCSEADAITKSMIASLYQAEIRTFEADCATSLCIHPQGMKPRNPNAKLNVCKDQELEINGRYHALIQPTHESLLLPYMKQLSHQTPSEINENEERIFEAFERFPLPKLGDQILYKIPYGSQNPLIAVLAGVIDAGKDLPLHLKTLSDVHGAVLKELESVFFTARSILEEGTHAANDNINESFKSAHYILTVVFPETLKAYNQRFHCELTTIEEYLKAMKDQPFWDAPLCWQALTDVFKVNLCIGSKPNDPPLLCDRSEYSQTVYLQKWGHQYNLLGEDETEDRIQNHPSLMQIVGELESARANKNSSRDKESSKALTDKDHATVLTWRRSSQENLSLPAESRATSQSSRAPLAEHETVSESESVEPSLKKQRRI